MRKFESVQTRLDQSQFERSSFRLQIAFDLDRENGLRNTVLFNPFKRKQYQIYHHFDLQREKAVDIRRPS